MSPAELAAFTAEAAAFTRSLEIYCWPGVLFGQRARPQGRWSKLSSPDPPPSSYRPTGMVYGSYQNFTVTETWPGTDCPFLVAGLYW